MKIVLLFNLAFLCLIRLSNAQTVTASAGAHSTSGTINLAWTIGEPITLTGKSSSVLLSSGYHQSTQIQGPANRVSVKKEVELSISVFPNPAQDVIHFAADPLQRYAVTIRSVSGKLVKAISVRGESELDLRDLTAGSYVLSVTSEDTKTNKTFRLTKIQ